jgi:hypothetical protein
MKLVSLFDVKTFLDFASTDVEHDSLLNLLTDTISKRIEMYLNRSLKKQSRTQYFDSGKKFYYLPAYPIDTTQTLTVTYDGDVQTVDDDYYVWAEEGLIEFDDETTHIDPKEVYIAWAGGYAEIAASEVLGTDGKNYTCKLAHVAATANKPITGADYATYWTQTGSAGIAWVSGSQYSDAYLGVPDDIKLAAIVQTAFTFRRRKDVGISSIAMPDGSVSVNVPLKLLSEVQDILKPYRRVPTTR